MSSVFGGHYRLIKRLGAGSFGEVFEAEEIKTHMIVGLKFEPKRASSPQLEHESSVYKNLQDGINFPRFYGFESDEKYNFVSMELLGKSLDELFHICDHKFSLKTVLLIIDQTLNAIEFVHKMHYIYCDIKPNNFLIGKEDSANQIYLIDFGLSKKYIDESTGEHIPYKEDQSIVGTARYASANALQGNQQSRKDDMIALGYMWIYFLKGTLPWIGLEKNELGASSQNNCNYDEVISMKKHTTPEQLCKDLPKHFVKYFQAVNDLKFDEEPNYSEYRLMFRKLFLFCYFTYDYKYDWSDNPLVEPPPVSPRQSNSLQASSRPKSSRVPSFAQRLCPLVPFPPNQRSTNPLPLDIRNKRRNSISNSKNVPIIEASPQKSSKQVNTKQNRKTNSQIIQPTNEPDETELPSPRRIDGKEFKNSKCKSPTSPNNENNEGKIEKVRISPPIPRPKSKPSPRQAHSMMPTQSLAHEFEAFELTEKDITELGPVKPPSNLQFRNSKNVPIIPIIPINKSKNNKTKLFSPRRSVSNPCDISPFDM